MLIWSLQTVPMFWGLAQLLRTISLWYAIGFTNQHYSLDINFGNYDHSVNTPIALGTPFQDGC